MARKFRKIDPRIWADEKFNRFSPEEQICAFYLMTGPLTNRIGYYYLSVGGAAEIFGCSLDTSRKRIKYVCETLNWRFDEAVSVLFISSWWRYNPPENFKVFSGALKDFDDVPNSFLAKEFFEKTESFAETYGKPIANVWHTFRKRIGNVSIQEQEQEQEQKQEQDEQPTPPEPEPLHQANVAFPIKGSSTVWMLTVAVVECCKKYNPQYTEDFIIKTCRKLALWCVNNPTKQKTLKGIARFVTSNVSNEITARDWRESQSKGHRPSNDRTERNLFDAAEALKEMQAREAQNESPLTEIGEG